jgi:hypothetical protein
MCSACGRPQSAARRRCAFCNAQLPEAPLPAASTSSAPPVPPPVALLALDLGQGRGLAASGERLTYQGRREGPPFDVPWSRVRRLEWRSRPYVEALGLLAFSALGAFAPTPLMRWMAFAAGAVGLLLAALYRHHGLSVEVEDGARLEWPLGMALRGSTREARLLAARATLEDAGRARGVTLSGPGA